MLLKKLQISNFLSIANAKIPFSSGFNVITGESGVGKSVFLNALEFLFGAKSSKGSFLDMIREGSGKITVAGELYFTSTEKVPSALSDHLNSQDESSQKSSNNTLHIQRQLFLNGKSEVHINGMPIPLMLWKEVGCQLISVLNQKWRYLLQEKNHLQHLDRFAYTGDLLEEYEKLWEKTISQSSRILHAVEGHLKHAPYLADYKKQLIVAKNLSPNTAHYNSLRDMCKEFESSFEKEKSLKAITSFFENSFNEQSLLSHLDALKKNHRHALKEDGALSSLSILLEELYEQTEKCSLELERLHEKKSFSQEDYDKAQDEMAAYQTLMRKFKVYSVDHLVERIEALSELTEKHDGFYDKLLIVCEDFFQNCTLLQAKATLLSQKRKNQIESFEQSILKEFSELALPHAHFVVKLEPIRSKVEILKLFDNFLLNGDEKIEPIEILWSKSQQILKQLSATGCDHVSFMFSSHPSHPLGLIDKLASGGEVSRVMLALKKVLLKHDAFSPIIVFDEIDTGVSGLIAHTVGKRLRTLSENFQMIAISHLPQIAACAHQHCVVTKTASSSEVFTSILALDKTERQRELARLLSGKEITPTSLKNAKDLLTSF